MKGGKTTLEKENELVVMMEEAISLYRDLDRKFTKAGATRLRVKLSEISKACKEERKEILAKTKAQ